MLPAVRLADCYPAGQVGGRNASVLEMIKKHWVALGTVATSYCANVACPISNGINGTVKEKIIAARK